VPEGSIFDEARRILSWIYQWVIVNDYLPRLAGRALVDEVLADGPRFYRPGPQPQIPLEFADAAFRYGHRHVRVLREADVRADGEGLGPVGGRIVTEVLLGMIDADPRSYRANDPDWSPPAAGPRSGVHARRQARPAARLTRVGSSGARVPLMRTLTAAPARP
jgi:Animal haem peroxidase